jgi:hypothetical protein
MSAWLVWSERTTIIVIYCCLLSFSDCSIIFVTVTHRKMSLYWCDRTAQLYNYCCCLLVFSDCSIIFVTVIIYGSSYLPTCAKTILPQQYFATCRSVGVIRKHIAIQLLLLFANFFWFQYSFCYRNTSQDVAMLVLSESTTPYNYCCCLLIFSDCGIIFVTLIIYRSAPFGYSLYCQHSQTKNYNMQLCCCDWKKTTLYNYCCCLLVFSDSSILFVTLIIYRSSYFP